MNQENPCNWNPKCQNGNLQNNYKNVKNNNQKGSAGSSVVRIMEEKSWRRNHGGGIMEEESLRRNHGGRIMEEESLRRNHGGGIIDEESWRRNH